MGIGYQQGLLIFESILAFFAILILYRMIEYYSIFIGMKRIWSYFVDFGAAAMLARFPTRLMGRYTLDYLYIRASHAIYDFFDFCIGICIAGVLIWIISFYVKYHKYKKLHTAGMTLVRKFVWEMKLGWQLLKTSFCPIKTWWKDVD